MAIEIDGYRPGAVASVVGLHARYYARHWNFGLPFEAKVAAELGEFMLRADPDRDLFLAAYSDGEPAASMVIDATGGGPRGAHLRWFIVGDELRGKGIGGELIRRAVDFCDRCGYERIWLTTFAGLDAARSLYEKHGFIHVEDIEKDQWSGGVREQIFERARFATRPETPPATGP